ncbi:MAG: flagellar hook capping protein [Micrococcales bacterium]|nr:flagellar hook capping protein [Micrococcales bacterium]MCL2667245.1 flagellar hook capping protein [Micrococcales bacterium]
MTDIPISSLGGATAVATQNAAPKNILDSDGFLKLLIAQLANQDPSSPMDTNQMMAQTTQLSMMEQMVSMANDSKAALAVQQRALASAMVGSQVTYAGPDDNNVTGTVEKVIYTVGEPTLVIDGQYVALSSVAAVASRPTPAGTPPAPETPGGQTPDADSDTNS